MISLAHPRQLEVSQQPLLGTEAEVPDLGTRAAGRAREQESVTVLASSDAPWDQGKGSPPSGSDLGVFLHAEKQHRREGKKKNPQVQGFYSKQSSLKKKEGATGYLWEPVMR